jgi:hypothetical protein
MAHPKRKRKLAQEKEYPLADAVKKHAPLGSVTPESRDASQDLGLYHVGCYARDQV